MKIRNRIVNQLIIKYVNAFKCVYKVVNKSVLYVYIVGKYC